MMVGIENTVYDIIEEEESAVCSPLSPGEHRTRANLLLFAARHTVAMIERLQADKPSPISALKKMTKVSTYGLSFGLLKPQINTGFQCWYNGL